MTETELRRFRDATAAITTSWLYVMHGLISREQAVRISTAVLNSCDDLPKLALGLLVDEHMTRAARIPEAS